MKELIYNPDNILDKDITDNKIINNYIFINDNKVLLKKHHNSYYFLHDVIDEDYDSKLFLIKKIYVLDYPFIGDKCLTVKNYYLINGNINVDSAEWINMDDIINLLESQKYNNPRVQDVTNEIIEVLNYLIVNCWYLLRINVQ